ncbi:hypothetical protein K443DRAFT_468575 [Laccaria amethystina LaAM-08-1]|uniref:Secreted protein n=1 Tax=Laccaria amethystina LaAM-08-1 TaxID=1095629 RepID=A0A0C9WTV4_9AGAR|nr:hypothetical protein K443DRAFT_468575 [Laccaria amethystina LaAM-08-1]
MHITTRTFALQFGYLLFCKTAVAVPCCSELHRSWPSDYRLRARSSMTLGCPVKFTIFLGESWGDKAANISNKL